MMKTWEFKSLKNNLKVVFLVKLKFQRILEFKIEWFIIAKNAQNDHHIEAATASKERMKKNMTTVCENDT